MFMNYNIIGCNAQEITVADVNPISQWWKKGDGTDAIKGLWESVSGVWSGDIDLNDRKLDQLYKEFEKKIKWAKDLGVQ